MTIKILLILASTPIQILFIHIVASRCLRQIPPQFMAFGCSIFGLVPMGFALFFFVFLRYPMTFAELFVTGLYAFIIYHALAYTYFHSFNMGETARRIKILYEINHAGILSKEALSINYGASEILSVRLKRLVDMKQLGRNGYYYVLTGRLLYFAALIVLAWSRLLGFRDARLVQKSNKPTTLF